MADGEHVYGVEMQGDPVPADMIGTGAVAIVRAMDGEGHTGVLIRYSPLLPTWEAIGLLEAALIVVRKQWEREVNDE